MNKNNNTFQRANEVDKERFTELLLAAKGNRTMQQFARACNVSPSTFTRIMQKANKSASSIKILEAIADHAAANSGVTFQALADANGYHIEVVRNNMSEQANYFYRKADWLTRNIIIQEFLGRGKEVELDFVQYGFSNTLFNYSGSVIITDAYVPELTACFVVSIKATLRQNNNKTYGYYADIKRLAFNYLSRFAFISMNNTSFSGALRFFIAVFDEEAYNIIIEEYDKTTVPADVSIIHVSLEENKIINEYVLPHVTKGHQSAYFMTTERTMDNTESQFDKYIEDEDNQGVFL